MPYDPNERARDLGYRSRGQREYIYKALGEGQVGPLRRRARELEEEENWTGLQALFADVYRRQSQRTFRPHGMSDEEYRSRLTDWLRGIVSPSAI